MATRVDLRELAGGRKGATPSAPPVRRRWSGVVLATRYIIPVLLLAGFAGVLTWAVRDSFVARVPVRVTPVLALRTEVETPETPLFQGAGWVEPRPTPVIVSALEEGVVERLEVIEGQLLQAGDEIARLIDADARLAVREAQADVDTCAAEMTLAEANLQAAKVREQEPVEKQAQLAEAQAQLARTENELNRLPGQLRAASARLNLAKKEVESRSQTGGATSRLALAKSESDVETAEAALAELAAQEKALQKEHDAQAARVVALQRLLTLKTEETRAVVEAEAEVQRILAARQKANVALEVAELRLSRMAVRAPTSGRVLSLVARPGSRVMGLTLAGQPEASTIVTMYNPAHLQIRADVRLEDIPRVRQGHPAQISTPAVKQPLKGHVIATTSYTDIQKNTVQVKVSIDEPPEVLKPDMLVTVTFLAPATVSTAPEAGTVPPVRLVIPADLPEEENGQRSVWVADQSEKVARRKEIQIGGLTPSGSREVTSGLSVGDQLILNPSEALQDGTPIEIHDGADRSSSKRKISPTK